MKLIRVLCLVLLGVGVLILLQLPDTPANRAEQQYPRLAEKDFTVLASQAWLTGQKGVALLLLDYATEQQLAGATACTQLRAGYLAALRDDTTPGGALTTFGLTQPTTGANNYQGLAGQSVADYFAYGGGARAWQTDSKPEAFQTLVQQARGAVTAVFAPAGSALTLAAAAHAHHALGAALINQLSQALHFVQADPTNALAAFAVQEAVMPIQQLGRPCKSWAVFLILLRNATSVDQVKLLTRIAVATPDSAHQLAQILAVTELAAPELNSRCIGFVMQHGVTGLRNLHAALAKGIPGVQLVLHDPALPAATLNTLSATAPRQVLGGAWWQAQQDQLGRQALLIKYALVALLCAALIALLIPWPLFRDTFAPATPLAGLGTGQLFRAYWLAIVLGAVAICLLLMLPAVTPLPSGAPGATPEVTAGSGGAATITSAAVTPPEQSQTASLVLLLLAILIVQGGCYWIARRKLREVELGTPPTGVAHKGGAADDAAGAALKLRRLENLDIFFDLPLYCGLALTIFAFLLITTFGAGVSRFLAYGSTFVGIIFAVILRVAYLYPLREKLIHQVSR
jgi:hypothetical protein